MDMLKEVYLRLCAAPVASGFEAEGHALLTELLSDCGLTLSRDNLSHFYARRPGSGRRILLLCAADCSGILPCYVSEEGMVRFGLLGSLSPTALCGHAVRFENGTLGIIGSDKPEPTAAADLYCDVGADSREAALASVCPGRPALLCDAPFGRERLFANYLDRHLPCAVLVCLARALAALPGDADVTAVFAAGSRLGHEAARVAAGTVAPELAVVLTHTPSGDAPGDKESCPARLGGGPALRLMDKGILCAPAALEALQAAAGRAGVCLQQELRPEEQSDGGPVHLAAGGIPTAVLALPLRGAGAAWQSASLRDAFDALSLLRELVSQPPSLA